MWFSADNPPLESGYYMTYNYNEEHQQYYYKAIWWNAKDMKWCKWYRSPRLSFHVLHYHHDRHDYYVPCILADREPLRA